MDFYQRLFGLLAIGVAFIGTHAIAQEEPPRPVLLTNVHIFDGVNEQRIQNANVLVQGNLIAEVSKEPIAVANAWWAHADSGTDRQPCAHQHVQEWQHPHSAGLDLGRDRRTGGRNGPGNAGNGVHHHARHVWCA